MKETPQSGLVQLSKNPTNGIRAGKTGAQPSMPKRIALVLLQGVETAEPGHGHEKRAGKDDARRNHRTPASVGQGGEKAFDSISTFRIGRESTENCLLRLLLSFQPVPGGGGDFLQESEDLTIALDPLARHRLMILGDMELFRLAVDDAGENEGGVLLATSALAIRFAASEVTQSGGGAEKLFPGDERLEHGTALSLDAGHSGRVHRGLFSYIFIIYKIIVPVKRFY
jgi:hypothetical protein